MTFWEIILPPVLTILVIVFTGLAILAVSILLNYIIPLIREKIGDTQFALWQNVASMIVRSIQQSPAFTDLANPEKKEKAMKMLSAWFEERDIPISVELLDSLIESAVQMMKEGTRPILNP